MSDAPRKLPLLAGNIRCPECGHPFRDIAQDYVISMDDPDDYSRLPSGRVDCHTMGHCLNGHRIGLYVRRGFYSVEVFG